MSALWHIPVWIAIGTPLTDYETTRDCLDLSLVLEIYFSDNEPLTGRVPFVFLYVT